SGSRARSPAGRIRSGSAPAAGPPSGTGVSGRAGFPFIAGWRRDARRSVRHSSVALPAGASLLEHVRADLDETVVDRLEMQPADIVAADMLAAVAGALRRDRHRRPAGRLDHQLLLAAALERDEPEGGRLDAV